MKIVLKSKKWNINRNTSHSLEECFKKPNQQQGNSETTIKLNDNTASKVSLNKQEIRIEEKQDYVEKKFQETPWI